MAGGFNMMALMNQATKNEAAKPKYEMKNLSIGEIIPNPANLYSIEDIEELADSILLAGRVLQNIVVKAADENGRYMIISGHRRYEACKKLVAEGHPEFDTIAALVENEADENLRELMLIYTNSTSRILTDAEKMHQAQRATEILKNLKAEGKLEGRIRETVARMLNTTGAQLARYAAIAKNLTNPELKEAFEDGRLGVSAAYEASGLSDEGQEQIADKLQEGGAVSIQDVTEVKEQEKPAEVKTTGEGIPIHEIPLNIKKKYKAKITILTVEKDGKFYSSSDTWYKNCGTSGYPSTLHDTPYDTEQEAIEAEIKEIAAHNHELHKILWESGYYIVGDPALLMDEGIEANKPVTIKSEAKPSAPPASVEETEPPAEPEEEKPPAPSDPKVYAANTVLNELTALKESYQGAAERHEAMSGDEQGKKNLEATAEYLQKLIEQVEEDMMVAISDAENAWRG